MVFHHLHDIHFIDWNKDVPQFPAAPEDLEASMSAALPVLFSAGWWHPPGDRARAALGAVAGQPLPRGNLRRHLRPPAGTCLPAREGERKEAQDGFALVVAIPCAITSDRQQS